MKFTEDELKEFNSMVGDEICLFCGLPYKYHGDNKLVKHDLITTQEQYDELIDKFKKGEK